ncbi:substrate-binding domain-containing protein [Pontiellaceae bacterium B12227]|nr:substrate-binding domain-containing protein [Pontiellaceae bacterium B12227]
MKGILSYANEVGPWHIWVNPNIKSDLTELPKGWRGDGIIARVSNPAFANEISSTGLPIVNVADTAIEGFSAPCIRTDDAAGTAMAAEHFINRGFRNIAYVGSSHSANPLWYGKAFKKAVAAHDLNVHEFCMQGAAADNIPRLLEWLKNLPKPIGILVWGHGNGRMVVEGCMSAGISVPHDVAVLCGSYDDLLSHAVFPALSGILNPTEQIGYKAAQTMHQLLQGKKVPHDTTYLPPLGIMERLSTDTLAVEDPKLVKVVSFLRDHAFESITMNDILREVPMARRSLERRFLQVFGRSPMDEVRRLRINKARKLLAETDLPMQEIAEACGFATYNYLTHVFKQVTEMTPRDYRKKMRTF